MVPNAPGTLASPTAPGHVAAISKPPGAYDCWGFVYEEQSPYLQPILLGKRPAVPDHVPAPVTMGVVDERWSRRGLDSALISVATPHAVALSHAAPKKFSTLVNKTLNSKFCLLAYIYLTRRSEYLRDSTRCYPCVACCGLGAVGCDVGGGCASKEEAETHLEAITADSSRLAPQKLYLGRNSLTQVKDCVVQATLQLAEDLLLANQVIVRTTERSSQQVFATWKQLTNALADRETHPQPNASELDMLCWLLQHCPISAWGDGSRFNELFGVTSDSDPGKRPVSFGTRGDWHAHMQCLMALAVAARREGRQQPEAEVEARTLTAYRGRYPNEPPPAARRKRSTKARAKAEATGDK